MIRTESCATPEDALTVAEALSAQIESHRSSLDHRSLFSAQFNRKLVKRIELLEAVRAEYVDLAAAMRYRDVTQQYADAALIHDKKS